MTVPTLRSRVAHAGWEEHRFFGRRVFADFAGAEDLAGLLLTSMDGRICSALERRLLAVVSSVTTLADPRIPPLLLARIIASEGRALPGVVAALHACDHARIGPWVTANAATLLAELVQELPDHERATDEQLIAFLRRRGAGGKLPGFGIPFRGADERVAALHLELVRLGWSGRHFALSRRLGELGRDRLGVPPNIALPSGAIGLDLGLRPEAAALLITLLAAHTFVANAEEGRLQAMAELRRLPREFVRYLGPAPRESPRALGRATTSVES